MPLSRVQATTSEMMSFCRTTLCWMPPLTSVTLSRLISRGLLMEHLISTFKLGSWANKSSQECKFIKTNVLSTCSRFLELFFSRVKIETLISWSNTARRCSTPSLGIDLTNSRQVALNLWLKKTYSLTEVSLS